MLLHENRLYLGAEGLFIYNSQDPASPQLLSNKGDWSKLIPLAVSGNYLFGLMAAPGAWERQILSVINVTDPVNPTAVKNHVASSVITKGVICGSRAYLLLQGTAAGGEIIDISTPSAPAKVGALPFPSYGQNDQHDIAASGNLAAIAGYTLEGNRVNIYDVTNAASPVLRSTLAPQGGNIRLWLKDATLMVVSTLNTGEVADNFIDAFDLTDPANPKRAGQIKTQKGAEDVKVLSQDGQDPIIALAKPGGSVHTFGYSPVTGTFTPGPVCPSPYSYQVTVSQSPNSAGGYTVVTSDSSFGTYTQEIKRKQTTCCVQTVVSPVEAAAEGCSATPQHSGEVECSSKVPVKATVKEPWNFKEWTGAATGTSLETEATATAHCSIATANFVKPTLTLSAAPSNPQPTNLIYAVESALSFRLTDDSFTRMAATGVPQAVRDKLQAIKFQKPTTHLYAGIPAFNTALAGVLTPQELADHGDAIFFHAQSHWKEDAVIAAIVLTANEVDDWTVTSVGFKASGSGDERSDQDVIKVKLYKNSVGGELLGQGTYSADDGNISFAVNIPIPKSQSVTLVLAYDFDAEKACPCDSFGTHTDMGMIAAKPDHYPNYVKLPIPPPGVDSGPSQINMGNMDIVSTNPQFGEPYDPQKTPPYTPLPEPLKVRVTWMDHLCAKDIPFTMEKKAADFKAKFDNDATSISVPLDGRNEAKAIMMLGEAKGMNPNNAYLVNAKLEGRGCQCTYPVYVIQTTLTAYGMGVDLPATAKYDGTQEGGDDGFGTFLNMIQMENEFIVTVDMAPPNFATIERVNFNLGGTLSMDGASLGNNQYKATFPLQSFDKPTIMRITCYMNKNGQTVTETADYTVKIIKLPSWVNVVSSLCHPESFVKEFSGDDKAYNFTFNYPTNFAWSDYV
ncbi:MAG TPA: hypothetical protein PLX72_06795, partial [Candidatus Syntrophosphaera sp.]|nr:hypothetical protein [Candidatus Syntrophosphaera sp.]